MLVLSRKLREKIQIGDDVTITILRVKGNSVRVGIEAPRSVKVVRGELPREVELTLSTDADLSAEANKVPMESRQRSNSTLNQSMSSAHANVSVFVSDPTDDRVIEINNDGPVKVHEASTNELPEELQSGSDPQTENAGGRAMGNQKSDAENGGKPSNSGYRSMSNASKKSIHGADSLPSGQNRLRQIADAIAKLG